MNNAIENMLGRYNCATTEDYKNALKEIIQEIALLGLFRSNFYDVAAFYGGSALRIFYGLERFSEDIDFSLLKKDRNFNLKHYCKYIQNELEAFGFEVEISVKQKADSNVESAFIKSGTLIHLLKIGVVKQPVSGIHENELLKIKFEVDTNPPAGASYEVKYLLTPVPFSVRIFSPGSLFAGKVHSLLCREWKGNRVKGRDMYDYIWYLSKSVPIDIRHLEKRMIQTGHLTDNVFLTKDVLIEYLDNKFRIIDFKQAKQDVLPFIKDSFSLKLWSADFFSAVTGEKLKIENG